MILRRLIDDQTHVERVWYDNDQFQFSKFIPNDDNTTGTLFMVDVNQKPTYDWDKEMHWVSALRFDNVRREDYLQPTFLSQHTGQPDSINIDEFVIPDEHCFEGKVVMEGSSDCFTEFFNHIDCKITIKEESKDLEWKKRAWPEEYFLHKLHLVNRYCDFNPGKMINVRYEELYSERATLTFSLSIGSYTLLQQLASEVLALTNHTEHFRVYTFGKDAQLSIWTGQQWVNSTEHPQLFCDVTSMPASPLYSAMLSAVYGMKVGEISPKSRTTVRPVAIDSAKGKWSIPEGVTALSKLDFPADALVNYLYIPASVVTIDIDILYFWNKNFKTQFIVDAENPIFYSLQGSLMLRDGDILLYPYVENRSCFVVPKGTKVVNIHADVHAWIGKIILPDGLIGFYAGGLTIKYLCCPSTILFISSLPTQGTIVMCAKNGYNIYYGGNLGAVIYNYRGTDIDLFVPKGSSHSYLHTGWNEESYEADTTWISVIELEEDKLLAMYNDTSVQRNSPLRPSAPPQPKQEESDDIKLEPWHNELNRERIFHLSLPGFTLDEFIKIQYSKEKGRKDLDRIGYAEALQNEFQRLQLEILPSAISASLITQETVGTTSTLHIHYSLVEKEIVGIYHFIHSDPILSQSTEIGQNTFQHLDDIFYRMILKKCQNDIVGYLQTQLIKRIPIQPYVTYTALPDPEQLSLF